MNDDRRSSFLKLFFAVCFLAIIARLFYWQILQGEKLKAKADYEHFYSLVLPAKRGEIKFSDNSTLVGNKDSYLLYSHLPELVGDKEKIAESLSGILTERLPVVSTRSSEISFEEKEFYYKNTKQILKNKLLDRLMYPNAVWVNLAHFIDKPTKAQINSLNNPGLQFENEQARDYPESSMSAHTIGFVGYDQNGNPKGYFGLEGFYERELAGRPGEIRIAKDAFGRPIALGSEDRLEKQDGESLVTTLDRTVQFFVEKELDKGIADWGATGGTAVVMDTSSGAIISIANSPKYDPANFSIFPTDIYKNPAVANLFEPGSIMKPLVMAAAINENKITPETLCTECSGPKFIGGYYIHTFDNRYHPNSTMTQVLVNSDNTGMVFVGEKLGFSGLYSYFEKYGFSKKTGIDLEEEVSGELRSANAYYPLERATMTFGQGISVTPLQIIRAFAAIANGGNLVTPHLVSKIETGSKSIDLKYPIGPRVFSPTTASTLTQMLVHVADESPEHFPKDAISELANFRIAAKSGTAQIAVGGEYAAKGTIASLIGFFPAENPRFLVFVKLNEPKVRPWGSDTAGPIFFGIIRDMIRYYGIAPQ